MSDDLIRREDAIKAVEERSFAVRDSYTVKAILRNVPSADKRGEWIPYEASLNFGDGEGYVIEHKCSACGYLWGEPDYKFCPNCGARMKGASNGN